MSDLLDRIDWNAVLNTAIAGVLSAAIVSVARQYLND